MWMSSLFSRLPAGCFRHCEFGTQALLEWLDGSCFPPRWCSLCLFSQVRSCDPCADCQPTDFQHSQFPPYWIWDQVIFRSRRFFLTLRRWLFFFGCSLLSHHLPSATSIRRLYRFTVAWIRLSEAIEKMLRSKQMKEKKKTKERKKKEFFFSLRQSQCLALCSGTQNLYIGQHRREICVAVEMACLDVSFW